MDITKVTDLDLDHQCNPMEPVCAVRIWGPFFVIFC